MPRVEPLGEIPGGGRVGDVEQFTADLGPAGRKARDGACDASGVAAGCGIATASALLAPIAPPGVRILPVRGGPRERRRLLLARLPGPMPAPATHVAAALTTALT